jgi:hypothetical protein
MSEVTEKELFDLLSEAFAAGVCSYADLSTSICQEILNRFLESKMDKKAVKIGINTTYSADFRNIEWNSEQLSNMHTFLSNIIVS